jgi:hypothetical protein
MFIRRVPHKNKKNHKEYGTYKLFESIRTEREPRQRDVLNLGVDFYLPREQWKDLANCLKEIITGQKTLINYPKTIRTSARRYARKIICEQAPVNSEGEDTVYFIIEGKLDIIKESIGVRHKSLCICVYNQVAHEEHESKKFTIFIYLRASSCSW